MLGQQKQNINTRKGKKKLKESKKETSAYDLRYLTLF